MLKNLYQNRIVKGRHLLKRVSLTELFAERKKYCGRNNYSTGNKGKKGVYPYAWLRDNAPEPHTYNIGDRNRARSLLMRELDPRVAPIAAELEKDGSSLNIRWPSETNIQACYPSSWLLSRNFSDPEFWRKRKGYYLDEEKTWGREEIEAVLQTPAKWEGLMSDDKYLRNYLVQFLQYGLLHVVGAPTEKNALQQLGDRLGYLLNSHLGKKDNKTGRNRGSATDASQVEGLMSDDKYLRDYLVQFLQYGLLHVVKAPTEKNALQKLGDRLGYLLNSHLGKKHNKGVFEVLVEIDPCNLMNTPKELGLHTDYAQYQVNTDIQILHVIRQAGEGGESQFTDGFRVARQLRQEQPEAFKTLTTYPVEFIDWGEYTYKYQFASSWRPIELDKDGNPVAIYYNNQVRSWYFDAPVEKIPEIYDALKILNDYLYQPRNMLQIKMQPGECMWFVNHRVLHGRSAFEAAEGHVSRYLEGAYLNLDTIRSKVRVIDEQLGRSQHASL